MDDLILQGTDAFYSGKLEEARKFFLAATKENPDSEKAWDLLYYVANDDNERIQCLKQIIRINPANNKAIASLDQLMNPKKITQVPTDKHQSISHSKWGILSFLISLILIVLGCSIPSMSTYQSYETLTISLTYCIFPLIWLTCIGFGIAGLVEKNRKRFFSILGLIINLIAFLPVLVMWVLGLMIGLPFCLFVAGSCHP